jgi:NitT/TauT family transport system ATP-binding protein
MSQTLLDVVHVQKTYPQRGRGQIEAIADVNFSVQAHEFLSIVGPSGAGKSTLLRIIAGLEPATCGNVLFETRVIVEPDPAIVLVFQDYGRSLLPWRSVLGNVLFGLEASSLSRQEKEQRALAALQQVGLEEFTRQYPGELSGGMQQRLQLARALAYQPRCMLMDEPFGSLDALTRAGLEDGLLAIWMLNPTTVVLVTHDIEEAVYLSDRVLLLSARPAYIVDELPIELPRPRHQLTTRADPRFAEYRNHLLGRVMSPPQTLPGS